MKVSCLKMAEPGSRLHYGLCHREGPVSARACLFSHAQPCVTPWTASPSDSCPRDFPGKNTGMGCHFLLQGIFWTQGLNLSVLHWEVDSLPLSHQGSPYSQHSSCHLSLVKTVL